MLHPLPTEQEKNCTASITARTATTPTRVISLIPIVAFIGRSSTGKTVSLKTLSSVWGSPEESMGMISDLNATQNAFFAQLGNCIGLPSIFDETSAVPEWDFTKMVYNLPKYI